MGLGYLLTSQSLFISRSNADSKMSDKTTPSLHTLPIYLIYRILDRLRPEEIFLSVCNLCTRLNAIIDTYQRYRVKLSLDISLNFDPLWFMNKNNRDVAVVIVQVR